MPWITPLNSKSQVDKAGEKLRDYAGVIPANEEMSVLDIIGNYRSSHGYSLNNYQNVMRGLARNNGGHYLIAQRLKRMPSILNKLVDRHGLRLTQIQDIGGCRLVVNGIDAVHRMVLKINKGRLRGKLIEKLSDDYISKPKTDGYRCVHMVFRYQKNNGESPFNGQRIEVQLRTKIQHAWATALESVDLFKRYKLKSGKGPKAWHDFFATVGSAFAYMENTPMVPGYCLSHRELRESIKEHMRDLKVIDTLKQYKAIVQTIDSIPIKRGERTFGYVLVKLNLIDNKLSMAGYRRDQFDRANKEFMDAEAQALINEREEVALVATDRIDELRKAYPNYYMDTEYFLESVDRFITSKARTQQSGAD